MTERNNNDRRNEMLSALVDDEASELELRRLLKDVGEDASVRTTWARYQMIGSVMRGETAALSTVDLSSSIMAALDDEPAHVASNRVGASKSSDKVGFWGNLGRFAVAASVAGAVVFSVQQLQTGTGGAPEVAVSQTPQAGPVADLPMGLLAPDFPSVRTVSAGDLSGHGSQKREQQAPLILVPIKGTAAGAELQAYLNGLMLEHAEHTANTGTGMMPFARIPRIDQALESARLSSDTASPAKPVTTATDK